MVTNKWYSCKPISIFLASSKHWCHSWSSSKRPCAMQASLKKTEVEPFSRCGMSMIHPTYSRDSLLPGGPLVCLLVSNHLGGKISIEKIAIICQLSICLKPCSKCGIMVWVCIHQVLDVAIFILFKDNRLLIREVDLKVNNRGGVLLHEKEIKVPKAS